MKRQSVIGYSALLLIVFPIASVWGQGVSGSKHDFSTATGPNVNYKFASSLCVTCHVPHGGTTGLAAPLWNHTVTSATFTVYDNTVSSTLNATVGQPDGVSKLCLSCHDGTVAVDSYGGATGTKIISGADSLGVNLSNDHPVSFVYNAALATADGGLVTPASATQVTAELPLFASSKLQCGTCHNPHGTLNTLFLRHAAATICTQCHNK